MQTSWKIRLVIALLALGVATYILYPSLVYFSLNDAEIREVRQSKSAFYKYLPKWSPKSHIVPGLDLQGGIHIVLGVDLDKAISDKTARAADRLVVFAKDEGITVSSVKQTGEDPHLQDHVEITLANASDANAFKEKVVKKFSDFQLVSTKGSVISLRLIPELVQSIRHDAVNQTITTITNRIDKMGVTEPSISRRGDDQVQIQLPGYENADAAKQMLGRTAQLQFQMAADDTTFLRDLKEAIRYVYVVLRSAYC